jgi:hypothetical protein
MDVFLSLYVIGNDDGPASLLPFLVAAEDEDEAVDLSDTFVEAIEMVASEDADADDLADSKATIDTLRGNICLLQDENEISVVTTCLTDHNPNFREEMQSLVGGVFTVGVTEEAGFSLKQANLLRNRMSSHYLLSVLSVEIE